MIYEKTRAGRRGVRLPASDVPPATPLPEGLLAKEAPLLPEVSELDMVRHFTNLSRRNFSVDTNFYPLGSCTMKYNPKVLENAAGLFSSSHPMTGFLPGGDNFVQGSLELIHELGKLLAEITGMSEVYQPVGRRPRRDDRHHADLRLPQGKGKQEEVRDRPRFITRDQPRLGSHDGLRDHHRADRALRRHGP